jgi:hypothetical protein
MAACAAFRKESRMKFANATKPDGKSGGAKWRDLRLLFPTLPSPGCRKSHPASKAIMKW